MTKKNLKVALVSLNQFDPWLRDGGSLTILERLNFFAHHGMKTCVLNFLTNDIYGRHKVIRVEGMGSYKGISPKSPIFTKPHNSIQYHQETIPYGYFDLFQNYKEVVRIIRATIECCKIDYVITLDNCLLSLLSANLLEIPGVHFFHCLSNVLTVANNRAFKLLLKKRVLLANSKFLKEKIEEVLGFNPEIWYPMLDFEKYRVLEKNSENNGIGFVSPTKSKGQEIVFEIARKMPNIRFVIVGDIIDDSIFKTLPNVIFMGRLQNMKKFYSKIKILLVPSLIHDSFPRVILESSVNGIPVIANRVGGIPEALGDSGIPIDAHLDKEINVVELSEKYIDEINKIFFDEEKYNIQRSKALKRVKEFQIEQNKRSFEILNKLFSFAN